MSTQREIPVANTGTPPPHVSFRAPAELRRMAEERAKREGDRRRTPPSVLVFTSADVAR
jgi:hypothetical protein